MEIEFATAAHQFVYEKVRAYLSESYEGYWSDEHYPIFRLIRGSAMAVVHVLAMGDLDALVRVVSYVVHEADVDDPTLLRYLLGKNAEVSFGAFGVDEDGDIFFDHTLVGTSCDREQLRTSLDWVLAVADEHDELIVQHWGGRRAVDKIAPEMPGMDYGLPGPAGFPRIRRDPGSERFTIRGVVPIEPIIALIEEGFRDEDIIVEHDELVIQDLDELHLFLDKMESLARGVDVKALMQTRGPQRDEKGEG